MSALLNTLFLNSCACARALAHTCTIKSTEITRRLDVLARIAKPGKNSFGKRTHVGADDNFLVEVAKVKLTCGRSTFAPQRA